jgi:hypothetical protein
MRPIRTADRMGLVQKKAAVRPRLPGRPCLPRMYRRRAVQRHCQQGQTCSCHNSYGTRSAFEFSRRTQRRVSGLAQFPDLCRPCLGQPTLTGTLDVEVFRPVRNSLSTRADQPSGFAQGYLSPGQHHQRSDFLMVFSGQFRLKGFDKRNKQFY